jgi:hypothetical protein
LFCVFVCLVYPMLPVSLLIASSVFCSVYLLLIVGSMIE